MCFGEVGHKTEKKEVSEGIPYFRKKQNYVVEDVTSGDVNQYKYTLNFNPKMWLPEISTIE